MHKLYLRYSVYFKKINKVIGETPHVPLEGVARPIGNLDWDKIFDFSEVDI